MLPKKSRVKKESFSKIMKEGVFLHTPSFYLRVQDRRDNSPSRFSFVVPAKVKKTSVGRHLIKRKMTSAVEKVLLDIKPGLSVIIFAKKDVFTHTFSEIEKEVLELLKKAKIL